MADLGLELFLNIEDKLFAFGPEFGDIAEGSFVWRLSLVGNFLVSFAVIQT
jgi:hypothetical protein